MTSSIPLETTINGPVQHVFDIATQVRFGPKWHVLTRAVTGAIDRPFLPGDEFIECIRTADGTVELAWRVAEHERGRRVTIELVDLPGSISYTFEEVPEGTLFRRVVNDTDSAPSGVVIADTETASVANQDALVEGILAQEKKGPALPSSRPREQPRVGGDDGGELRESRQLLARAAHAGHPEVIEHLESLTAR
ncbi:SRPBCC family protein [Streptomyces bobili]|uniref:SRPBCC family protein n=1 Tax=Streptomyces bobili TaxID=67280 RepID=UPI0033BE207A